MRLIKLFSPDLSLQEVHVQFCPDSQILKFKYRNYPIRGPEKIR
jgi:hypothetical protein